jgi:hypothetical protein
VEIPIFAALKNASATENPVSTSRSRCSIRHGVRTSMNGTAKSAQRGSHTHGEFTPRPNAPG